VPALEGFARLLTAQGAASTRLSLVDGIPPSPAAGSPEVLVHVVEVVIVVVVIAGKVASR
jgi:hypothetical protein